MKNINIKLLVILFLPFSCVNHKEQEVNNQTCIDNYLSKTFQIQLDTLDGKLVFIDYIGCKPCINKALNHFFNSHNSKQEFVFIIPNGKKKELNKFYNIGTKKYKYRNTFPDNASFVILVDSTNALYSQNILINGLSVYHIQNSKIIEVKTIDTEDINQKHLENFWFSW